MPVTVKPSMYSDEVALDILLCMKTEAIKKGYIHCDTNEFEFDIETYTFGTPNGVHVVGVHYWVDPKREYEFYSEIKNDLCLNYYSNRLWE